MTLHLIVSSIFCCCKINGALGVKWYKCHHLRVYGEVNNNLVSDIL